MTPASPPPAPQSPPARQLAPVSVVMPVLNEERHLAAAVRGVLDQHYPAGLEVIVAVGPSRDRTAEIAAELATSDARVQVVDNPSGRTPRGLNLAIAAARYDIIVRVDGHGELTPGYIARAVELLQETGAANVGGVMDAQGESPFEEAVAYAYTTRLGLGGSTFHLEDSPAGPADTVFLGVFRKEALDRLGGFDETMHRAQDWELNYRLRRAGELIWFSPELKVTYRPRASLKPLVRQFFETGKWRREVVRRYPETAGSRYLAPPAMVLGVSTGTALGLLATVFHRRWLRLGFLAPLGYWALVTGGAALAPKTLSPAARVELPLVLAAMHIAWGAGFLVGLRPSRTIPTSTG